MRAFGSFSAKVAIQLNDTHPALTVAELMRMLVDEKNLALGRGLGNHAGDCGLHQSHTAARGAGEVVGCRCWSTCLPRHLQIIYEINRRFLEQVAWHCPGDIERLQRMSLIEESSPKQVRMANLAMVGSHSVNGVSALHTELVKTSLVPDFYQLWPERFNNKTNGVTPAAVVAASEPAAGAVDHAHHRRLAGLRDLDALRALEPLPWMRVSRQEFLRIKRANKERLAESFASDTRVPVDPESLFDIQMKRIHEYKRQLLNVLHIIHEYLS